MSAEGAEAAQPREAASLARDPDIVTTEELAGLLGVNALTIQGLRDRGVISYMDTGPETVASTPGKGGGSIRYSYSQVKQELLENAERRRQQRLARRQEVSGGQVEEVVRLMDVALNAGRDPSAEAIGQELGIGDKRAKELFAEAAEVIAERDGLITRTTIADELGVELKRVHTLMLRKDAPRPVFKGGKLLYYRRAEVARLLEAANLS
jgi:hypothetical protein